VTERYKLSPRPSLLNLIVYCLLNFESYPPVNRVQLTAPSRPVGRTSKTWHLTVSPVVQWVTLALVILVMAGVAGMMLLSSRGTLSGSEFSEIAIATHRQHLLGSLPLDVHDGLSTSHQSMAKSKVPVPTRTSRFPRSARRAIRLRSEWCMAGGRRRQERSFHRLPGTPSS